ncbi:MAG: hypothetical protein ACYDGM_10120 [Vulcanimicrobiaceae bacterium]
MEDVDLDGGLRQEVDQLSFAVEAQSYRIKATLTRRALIPLAEEFALLAIRILEVARPETIRDFFGYTDAEVTVLIRELLSKEWVEYSLFGMKLTPSGEALFTNSDGDDPAIIETYPYERSIGFEKLSFGPLPRASGRSVPKAFMRVNGDRTKIEDSRTHVRIGFSRFFKDIVSDAEDRAFSSLDIYSINEIEPKRGFRYVANVPIISDLANSCATKALVSEAVPYGDLERRLDLSASIAQAVETCSSRGSVKSALEFLEYIQPSLQPFTRGIIPWGGMHENAYRDGISSVNEDDEIGIFGALSLRPGREAFLQISGIDEGRQVAKGVVWLKRNFSICLVPATSDFICGLTLPEYLAAG